MKKLWMIEVGGKAGNANTEVHDIRFIAADALEDTYAVLRREWFGTDLHIDAYREVRSADGWQVMLTPEEPRDGPGLYFVNQGGWVPGQFEEAHEYRLFAAAAEAEAKRRGKAELLTAAGDRHCDAVFAVQDRLVSADGQPAFLRLLPAAGDAVPDEIFHTYLVLA